MNPEHLEIVMEGKEAIDLWREANPDQQFDLSGANMIGASLSDSNLSRANLYGANLSWADLSGADLSDAYLSRSDLSWANLSGADLSDAYLWVCQLLQVSLAGAELTGAKLWGAARDGWNIENVKCRYVYWDSASKERSPKDRDLEPGEFELLYAQLPTIEYIFENGMNALDISVMDSIVQAITERKPEFNLRIAMANFQGLYPTVKFTVQLEEQKASALNTITQGYEAKKKELEAQKDILYQLVSESLENPQKVNIIIAELKAANKTLTDIIYRMIDRPPTNMTADVMALYGSSINIQEYIGHLEEIEQAIKEAPPETFVETTKQEALEIVKGAWKGMATEKVKEAAEAVTQLGFKLGPGLANSAAFQFFTNLAG